MSVDIGIIAGTYVNVLKLTYAQADAIRSLRALEKVCGKYQGEFMFPSVTILKVQAKPDTLRQIFPTPGSFEQCFLLPEGGYEKAVGRIRNDIMPDGDRSPVYGRYPRGWYSSGDTIDLWLSMRWPDSAMRVYDTYPQEGSRGIWLKGAEIGWRMLDLLDEEAVRRVDPLTALKEVKP